MELLCNKSLCTGCGACASICKLNCIDMIEDENGFYVPSINTSKCINCGKCNSVCPVIHPQNYHRENIKYYAGWVKNRNKRFKSSSGGAFGALAEWVLSQGGIVFGAAFDNDFSRVIHTDTTKVDISKLKKSKYVESYMGLTCRRVEEYLKADKWVLFCGTPCQVMGLNNYLGEKYEKLILCDFFCHGVPSNRVLQKYLDELKSRYGRKILNIDFRSKKLGWKTQCIKIDFDDGRSYFKTSIEDPYFKLFLLNISLRECCYKCDRPSRSVADITLGDFWGVKHVSHIKDTDEGISILVIHTDKGKESLNYIKDEMELFELKFGDVAYVYKKKNIKSAYRERFFEDLNNGSFYFFENDILPKLKFKDIIKSFLLRRKYSRTLLYKLAGKFNRRN